MKFVHKNCLAAKTYAVFNTSRRVDNLEKYLPLQNKVGYAQESEHEAESWSIPRALWLFMYAGFYYIRILLCRIFKSSILT